MYKLKTAGDVMSIGLATMSLNWLPPLLAAIASLMSIAWTGVRLYEYYKNKKAIGGD